MDPFIVTVKQIAQLTKPAFQLAFSQNNIKKSFEKPCLWPLNSLAFKDDHFVSSYANQMLIKSTSAEQENAGPFVIRFFEFYQQN